MDLRFDAPDYAGSLMRFGTAAGIDPLRIVQARQVHGTEVIDAKDHAKSHESTAAQTDAEADAIVAEPGFAAGIRVADCVPILIGDPIHGIAAAIHAGWRGTVSGVIQATLDRFTALGGDPSHTVAAIGPCICGLCFEVGDDVALRITHALGDESMVTRSLASKKPHVDLRLSVRLLLGRAGVAVIEDVPGCTRCEKERFFSYRRDGEASGRHLAAIAACPGAPAHRIST